MDESRVGHNEKNLRESEATSKETLEDLEETEKVTDNNRRERVSSPDGTFDENEELDKAGPM